MPEAADGGPTLGNDSIHPLQDHPLFGPLPLELQLNIEGNNPWWRGEEMPRPPAFHRWPFERLLRMVKEGMTPATVLRGPRRVGKTILIRQVMQALLGEGVDGRRILYVAFDELPTLRGIKEPVLAISRWFEREVLKESFNASANAGRSVYIFLDEVQNLDAWAPQVKNLVDNHAVRILITSIIRPYWRPSHDIGIQSGLGLKAWMLRIASLLAFERKTRGLRRFLLAMA